MHDYDTPPEVAGDGLGRPNMRLIASARMTEGTFELVEDVRDEGSGPPPHVHRDHDEAFYVLDGRFTFTRGTHEIDAGPGTFVFVPRGSRHAYRSKADGSRTLFFVTPIGLADFLRAQGRLLADGMDVRAAMASLEDRFDSHPVD